MEDVPSEVGGWVGQPWKGCWSLGWMDMVLGALKKEGSRRRGPEHNMAWEMLHGENWPGVTCELPVSGPACPAGMEYKECVSPCTRTCQSLHINEVCQEQCVDGCRCPGNKRPLYLLTQDLASPRGVGKPDEGYLCLFPIAEIRGLLFIF